MKKLLALILLVGFGVQAQTNLSVVSTYKLTNYVQDELAKITFSERWTTNSQLLILDEDVDDDFDAGTFSVGHGLMNEGLARIIATCSSSTNYPSARTVAAYNFFYGRTNIPVGYHSTPLAAYEGYGNRGSNYYNYISTNYLPRHNYDPDPNIMDATTVYRYALASITTTNKVKIICGGQLRNIYNLLISPADLISPLTGYQLMTNKVDELIFVAGYNPGGISAEYNIQTGGPAASNLCWMLTNIPTTWLGCNFDTNNPVADYNAPFTGSELNLGHPQDSPIRLTLDFMIHSGFYGTRTWTTGRESWTTFGVLYAVFGTNIGFIKYPGTNRVYGVGVNWMNTFTPSATGPHNMLQVATGRTNDLVKMVTSYEAALRVGFSGSGTYGNGSIFDTIDGPMANWIWNYSTNSQASSILALNNDTTITDIVALGTNYNYPTYGYGTNAGSLQIINRNGPIIFKTDNTSSGAADSAVAMTIGSDRKVAIGSNWLTSSAALSVANLSVGINNVYPGSNTLYTAGDILSSGVIQAYGNTNAMFRLRRGSTELGAFGADDYSNLCLIAPTNSVVVRHMSNDLYFANYYGNSYNQIAQNGDLKTTKIYTTNTINLAGNSNSIINFKIGGDTHYAIGLEDGGVMGTGTPTNSLVFRTTTNDIYFTSGLVGDIKVKIDTNGQIFATNGFDSSTNYYYKSRPIITILDAATNLHLGDSGNLTATGYGNISIGWKSLTNNSVGIQNLGIGVGTLRLNTAGCDNVAIGDRVLGSNTIGNFNVGVGSASLFYNTEGTENTAIGCQSMYYNLTGSNNTAVGLCSLMDNSTGLNNVGIGYSALYHNESGDGNTALGKQALFGNQLGDYNTAIGYLSMMFNTNSSFNIGGGFQALYNHINGDWNTAYGSVSLFSDTNGAQNTAIGAYALYDASVASGGNNTVVGFNSGRGVVTGTNNTILGANVTGLSPSLWGNIIIADGFGNKRINVDSSGNITAGGSMTATNALTTLNNIYSAGAVYATNAFYVKVPDTAQAGAMTSPIGYFGVMNQRYESNSVTLSLTDYTNVVSYGTTLTNGFIAVPSTGYLTNLYAGYYDISVSISDLGAANQMLEGCVLTNKVDSELIGFKKQFSNTQPRAAAQEARSIMYLPANTGISFGIKSTNDTTAITIHKANITIRGL